MNRHAQLLGSRGGQTTAKKYGNSYMKELSKKAVEARKRKMMQFDTLEAKMLVDNTDRSV